MSNENSTTNIPRRIRRGSNAPSGRARKFSCITYLNETQLKIKLLEHSEQIRVYAYAYHDKDVKEDGSLKEPHTHLIIVTYCTVTLSAIRRWFSGYVDSKGMEITTTAQVCQDVFKMYDYLTHSDIESVKAGKYLYDKSIVLCNDKNYFRGSSESEWDNIQIATQMLLDGKNPYDIGRIFGRDYILHYSQLKQYVSDMMLIKDKEFNSIRELIQYQIKLDLERSNKNA